MRVALVSSVVLSALLLSGCGTTTPKPFTPPSLQDIAPVKETSGTVVILAPRIGVGLKGNPFVYYDYFLDCKEERCKVGKMRYGEYITLDVPFGFHSIFITPSKEGFANSLLVVGGNDIYEQHINVIKGKRHFISHEWTNAFTNGLLEPFSVLPSVTRDMTETDGMEALHKLLEDHETTGGKFNNYGVKGIVYKK